MKKLKRVLSLILCILLALPVFSLAAGALRPYVTVPADAASPGYAGKKFTGGYEPYSLKFKDVPATSWYFESVNFMFNEKVIYGTSETSFSPSAVLNRAMAAALIARLTGEDISGYENTFRDVPEGAYYRDSVAYLASIGVVSGMGNSLFSPLSAGSREQFAAILYRYAAYSGIDVSARADLSAFKDNNKISAWAKDSLSWAVAAGLISGTSKDVLDPRGSVTRAQAVAILYRYTEKFILEYAGEIEVSKAFSDNMIIQREEKITVWGNVTDKEYNEGSFAPGQYVKADLGGKAAGYGQVGEDGRYEIVLDRTLPASDKPLTLTVKAGANEVKFDNILVGDVYMIIGQSNVYYSTNHYLVTFPDKVKAQAWDKYFTNIKDYDNSVRLFRNSSEDYKYYGDKVAFGGEHLKVNGSSAQFKGNEAVIQERGWQKPSDAARDYDSTYYNYRETGKAPGSAAEIFSALGYYTACELSKKSGVPTGMIEIDASGYSIAAFMPGELLEGYDYVGTSVHGAEDVYVDDATGMASRYAYNQQIHPIRKFSIAGIIWYQGESDCTNTEAVRGKDSYFFAKRLTDLINYFKNNFGNSDFGTFFMEYPAVCDLDPTFYMDFGVSRAELQRAAYNLDNALVVPSSDLNTEINSPFDSVHTYCKPAMAQRLSDVISATVYGKGKLENSVGPMIENIEYSGDCVTLTFDTDVKFDGEYAGGFYLLYTGSYSGGYSRCGSAHAYYPRNFVEVTDKNKVEIINGNQIKITGSQTILGVGYHIVAERYFPANVNLCNTLGIPALSFIDMSMYSVRDTVDESVYRSYLTDEEYSLPGDLPYYLLQIAINRDKAENGELVTGYENDVAKLISCLKTMIDVEGVDLDRDSVEALRQKFIVDYLSAVASVKAAGISTNDLEALHDKWRAEIYQISVYEGEENWIGKDDGWKKPVPIGDSGDEDEGDENP